ncbi:MAG: COX15/CtaA family protein [Solirubrobacterales bacterium]
MPSANALRRFRLSVYGALVVAFLLVVIGGVVRVSDSGLGCGPGGSGLHGWPLCQGRFVPAARAHTIIEYTHRFLAASVVVLLAAILWQALRRFRDRRALLGAAVLAMLLVCAQALLGALTVEHGLGTALVAAHLGTAMLLLGVLVVLAVAVRDRSPTGSTAPALRGVAVLSCALLFATIVAGGVVAGSEGHGTPGGERSDGAHLACGREFPSCNGAFLPYGESEPVDIQLAHRTAMFLAVAAIVALALLLRRHRRGKLALAISLVLATQVFLGGLNVWAGESAALVVAHLAVATLLWLLVATAVASTRPLAAPVAGRRWRPASPGPLPHGPSRGAPPRPERAQHG